MRLGYEQNKSVKADQYTKSEIYTVKQTIIYYTDCNRNTWQMNVDFGSGQYFFIFYLLTLALHNILCDVSFFMFKYWN